MVALLNSYWEAGTNTAELLSLKMRTRWVTAAWLAAVIVASVAPYASSLSGEFVLDDAQLIVGDPLSQSLSNASKAFTSYFLRGYQGTEHLYYRPLITISYQANCSLAGPDPFAFRLTNLLLNVLAAVLVFVLARRLTKSTFAAGAAGVAFAVLPSHAQVAAWIAGRTDLIASLFVLGGFLTFLAAYRIRTAFNWPLAALCSLLYGCALFSKESAAILPVLCAAYVWVFGPRPRRDEVVKWLAVAIPPLVIYLVLRRYALGCLVDCGGSYLLKERVLRLGSVYATYLRLLFVPQEARVYYGSLASRMRFSPADLAALTIPVGLIAVSIWARRMRIVAFGTAWIFFGLLPYSDIVPTRTILPTERFAYLASVGSSILLGWFVWRLWEYRPPNVRTLPAAVALLALTYALYSISVGVCNSYYYTSNLAWARLVAKTDPPHQELRLLAARFFVDAECVTESAGEFEAALALGSGRLSGAKNAQLECRVGEIFAREGEMEKAARAFRLATEAKPDMGKAWRDLARADLRLGRLAKAAEEFQRAFLLIQPTPRDRFEVGVAYAGLGRTKEARRELQRVISEDPESGLADRARLVLKSPKR